jgi:hypothetical protein
MANVELAFRYTGHLCRVAGSEGTDVARGDTELRGRRETWAELLYRIFCGNDERLQELALMCLTEDYD